MTGATPVTALDYPLADDAIAQVPVEPRDAARMLVDRGPHQTPEDRGVRNLPSLLDPGDVLVVNDTRVLPARLRATKSTGGAVEVLLLEREPIGTWRALVRPGRRVPPGTRVTAGDLEIEVGEDLGDGVRRVRLLPGAGRAGSTLLLDAGPTDAGPRDTGLSDTGLSDTGLSDTGPPPSAPDEAEDPARGATGGPAPADDGRVEELEALAEQGELPLPPYVHVPLADPERYQTIYARTPGSVAAPTAGLHLTDRVLDGCRQRGVRIESVDLRVGLGTFRPLATDTIEAHRMHAEGYRVSPEVLDACERARAHGRRVVAVGTTTLRALETASTTGRLEGHTDIYIHGDHPFAVVDRLLTNFHQPRSSLLALVDAFVGHRWHHLYDHARTAGYRFLSFGDCCLLDHRWGRAS